MLQIIKLLVLSDSPSEQGSFDKISFSIVMKFENDHTQKTNRDTIHFETKKGDISKSSNSILYQW